MLMMWYEGKSETVVEDDEVVGACSSFSSSVPDPSLRYIQSRFHWDLS